MILITVLKITMLKQVTVISGTHPMTSGHQPPLESSNVWNPPITEGRWKGIRDRLVKKGKGKKRKSGEIARREKHNTNKKRKKTELENDTERVLVCLSNRTNRILRLDLDNRGT